MLNSAKQKFLKYVALVVIVLFVMTIPVVIILSFTTSVFDDAFGGLEKQSGIRVPIVMYHGILQKSKDLGKFVITPTEFENDVKYLKDHGYDSVSMTDLINYVYNDADLPPKPVVLSFDDGFYNNYIYATPILEKYQMKAVISIVGKYSDESTKAADNNVGYSYLTWEQIKNMSDSGYFEIQNHTYNLHMIGSKRRGATKRNGESIEAYKTLLNSDIGKTQERLTKATGIVPNTFTYPYGFVSKDSVPILKEMGFKATLSCDEGVNFIDKNKTDILFGLKRENRPHGISTGNFFRKFCP
ncbi:MAG TPA: polysaccharide deacetylase family protein [Ruminiclostridium sp.]|nr:polysaccharide deacetylase family protein [Ruminiclostridium sp.]